MQNRQCFRGGMATGTIVLKSHLPIEVGTKHLINHVITCLRLEENDSNDSSIQQCTECFS